MSETTPNITVDQLTDADLEAAAREAARRKRARADADRARIPELTDADLEALIERVEDEDGACEDSPEWEHRIDPDAGCPACAARYELAVRESAAAAQLPGADPNRYIRGVQIVSHSARAAADLEPGDTAAHRPRPGTDDLEYVAVVAVEAPDRDTRRVTWRRTNDAAAVPFTVTYAGADCLRVSRVTSVTRRRNP